MEKDVEFINVIDEETGKEERLEVLTYLEIEDIKSEYVVAVKAGEEEAVVFKILTNEDGSNELVTIEDEAEFAMVEEAYSLIMEEE